MGAKYLCVYLNDNQKGRAYMKWKWLFYTVNSWKSKLKDLRHTMEQFISHKSVELITVVVIQFMLYHVGVYFDVYLLTTFVVTRSHRTGQYLCA